MKKTRGKKRGRASKEMFRGDERKEERRKGGVRLGGEKEKIF